MGGLNNILPQETHSFDALVFLKVNCIKNMLPGCSSVIDLVTAKAIACDSYDFHLITSINKRIRMQMVQNGDGFVNILVCV